MDTEIRYLEMENLSPSYYMWNVLDPGVETVRRRLARMFGVDPEEIAITRNASEANEIIQLGMKLKPGDEVITTNQDYPRMITTWQQRERRDGIVLKQLTLPVPPPSMDYLVKMFEDAITPRTKVIHICHITNRTGQIFPVKKICQMARARGIETIVDGAHAFAQFPVQARRPRLRLLRHVTAQMGAGADRHRHAVRPQEQDSDHLADDGRARIDAGQHPQVRRDRHASGLAAQRHHRGDEFPRKHRTGAQGRALPLPAQALVERSCASCPA